MKDVRDLIRLWPSYSAMALSLQDYTDRNVTGETIRKWYERNHIHSKWLWCIYLAGLDEKPRSRFEVLTPRNILIACNNYYGK